VDEIDRENAAGLHGQELLPLRTRTARCGVNSPACRILPHGGGSDRVAELDEFALHAPAPQVGLYVAMRITSFGSQLLWTVVQGAAGWRSPNCGVTSRRCQASSVASVTANTPRPMWCRGISRDSAASHSRSAGW
jgi:hypothetical protein